MEYLTITLHIHNHSVIYCCRLSHYCLILSFWSYNIIQCSIQAVMFMSRKWFCNLRFYIRLSWKYVLQIFLCADMSSDHYKNDKNYHNSHVQFEWFLLDLLLLLDLCCGSSNSNIQVAYLCHAKYLVLVVSLVNVWSSRGAEWDVTTNSSQWRREGDVKPGTKLRHCW